MADCGLLRLVAPPTSQLGQVATSSIRIQAGQLSGGGAAWAGLKPPREPLQWNPLHCEALQWKQARQSAERRTRPAASRCGLGSPEQKDGDLRELSRRLERIYKEGEAQQGAAPEAARCQPQQQRGCGRQRQDVPVFPVQWAVLPGGTDLLHIYMPHFVHMFEALLAGPRPWIFFHLFVPPRAPAPNACAAGAIGTLEEICHVERLRDGRLLLRTRATKRACVVEELQTGAYTRALVEVLSDEEEWIAAACARAAGLGALHGQDAERGDPGRAAAVAAVSKLQRGELEFWDVYDSVRELSRTLRLDRVLQPPPDAVAALLPPGRRPRSSSPSQGRARRLFSAESTAAAFRRVQELSFAAAAVLPSVSKGPGRQRLLEAGSVRQRLGIVVAALLAERAELAAHNALKKALDQ